MANNYKGESRDLEAGMDRDAFSALVEGASSRWMATGEGTGEESPDEGKGGGEKGKYGSRWAPNVDGSAWLARGVPRDDAWAAIVQNKGTKGNGKGTEGQGKGKGKFKGKGKDKGKDA